MRPLSDIQAIKVRLHNLINFLNEDKDVEDIYYESMCKSMLEETDILIKHIKRKSGLSEKHKMYVDGHAVLNICNYPLKFITSKGIVTAWPCGFVLPNEQKVDSRFKKKLQSFHEQFSFIKIVGSLENAAIYEEVFFAKPSTQILDGKQLNLPEFMKWSPDLVKNLV